MATITRITAATTPPPTTAAVRYHGELRLDGIFGRYAHEDEKDVKVAAGHGGPRDPGSEAA
jgi:hypothetical protein